MEKSYNIYRNLGYWFLAFIVLLALGFYRTYFSILLQPRPLLIHIHFTLMFLWMLTIIIQPFLIQYKKLPAHRFIGKLTYVLVPAVLISAFFMMRYSYFNFINANLANTPDHSLLLQHAATWVSITFLYAGWMAILYSLGIKNRKRSPVHMRYMVALSLTLLGPTVDRIIGLLLNIPILPGGIPVETFSFILQDIILALLLINDYRRKKSTRTYWICLSIYVIGQVAYFTIPYTSVWSDFVRLLMQPSL